MKKLANSMKFVWPLTLAGWLAVCGLGLPGCTISPGGATAGAAPTPPPDGTAIELSSGWFLQDAAKVAAGGAVISQPLCATTGWYKATVPGTVLTSLVNDGVYPEPLYGENNRPDKIPESLCRTSYWYRTSAMVPGSFRDKHVWLNFSGINYRAEVWVNGHQAGEIKGAFSRGIFDITPWVTPGAPAVVAVHILPPPHPGAPIEQTIKNGVGPNGGILAEDGPTFLCTMGWDWIPGIRDRNMGIWQKVTLGATGPVVLQDPLVTSDLPLPRTDTADLTVQATVHNITTAPQTCDLTATIEGITFTTGIALEPNETRTLTFNPATTPQLHLINPRLWWPNGFGPQNRYTLHLAVQSGAALSDQRDITFGIRKITYHVPGTENLTLSVNGVPVLAKGGDWGMDEAMKRIPRSRLEGQIRMHQLANYTIIRNWVGQSTSEDFYDLCDQYGILLWDEFFQPNPSDGPNPLDTSLYLANVREKVLRVRNHPSIAVWCARNEGDPPPEIDRGIQKIMDELEPTRLYQRSSTSGRGVNSGGPYHWRTPREFYNFGEAFKTEIGSVSVPTLEAIQAMMPAKDWSSINDDWAEHDFAKGAQGGDWYPGVLAQRYGPLANLPDFVRKAQLANFEAFRAMYEGRNARLFHPCSGVITWMSNPAQPSFVWQLYSYDLEPNAALFGTRKACEPVHVQMNQNNWHVMVINNTAAQLPDLHARATVCNLDGTISHQQEWTGTGGPSAATDLGAIDWPQNLSPVHFIKVELRAGSGRLLSDNFYWRALPAQQDDFTALNRLPTVKVESQVVRHDAAGQCLLDVTLRNPSATVALMAHLQLRQQHSGRRVLPVYYSDNYLSLLPGETRVISITAALADLQGDKPLLVLDGWNLTTDAQTFAGASIALNAGAQVASMPATGLEIIGTLAPARSVKMQCGGEAGAGFAADDGFQGGSTNVTKVAVDTSAPHAGPPQLYTTERWGPCTYTLPMKPLEPGYSYTVRLHFAELKFTAPGQRLFNVAINGQKVLKDFDIFQAAGGRNKALVKDFSGLRPDKAGRIIIQLQPGTADQPKICGLEIFAVGS